MSAAKKVYSFPGTTSYIVPVPGSTVVAYVSVRDAEPTEWIYSLWTSDEEELIAADQVTLPERVTPEQVARIAFILEVGN